MMRKISLLILPRIRICRFRATRRPALLWSLTLLLSKSKLLLGAKIKFQMPNQFQKVKLLLPLLKLNLLKYLVVQKSRRRKMESLISSRVSCHNLKLVKEMWEETPKAKLTRIAPLLLRLNSMLLI